jgi:hypothetical protein
MAMVRFLKDLLLSGGGVGDRQPGASDGARMSAELGNHGVINRDANVIDAGSSAARYFARGRDQAIAELTRPDEGDVALGRDDALVMGVAGKGR